MRITSIIQNISDLGKSVKNTLRCKSQSSVLPRLELLRQAIRVSLLERDSAGSAHLEQLCCGHEPKGPGGGTGRLHHTRGKTDVLISSPWYPKTIQYNLLNFFPEEV